MHENYIDAIYRAKIRGMSDKAWAMAVGVSPSTVSAWRVTGRQVMEAIDNGASLDLFSPHEINCYEFEKALNKGKAQRIKDALEVVNDSLTEDRDLKTAWRVLETEDKDKYNPDKTSRTLNVTANITSDQAIKAIQSVLRAAQLPSGEDNIIEHRDDSA